MNPETSTEGLEHIPQEPVLIIPNRVDPVALRALEEALGEGKVAWLVEDTLRPGEDIMSYMWKKQAPGLLCSMEHMSRESLVAKIHARLTAGQHVALLPGRVAQAPAGYTDVPPKLLHYLLDKYPLPTLPVYVGMYNRRKPPLVTTEQPYEQLILRFMPVVRTNVPAADGVTAAWLEAAAEQVAQMSEDYDDTLPEALLSSLMAHSHSMLIDGVDDTRMSYKQLLAQAVSLADRLRRQTNSKRIGIILPPGKFAIVANVACILAGIVPVNIDYTYDKAAFERLTKQAGLTRYITEHRFVEMQRNFPWPMHRDILFIDEMGQPTSIGLLSSRGILSRWVTPSRILKWIRTPKATPMDEALAVFSPAEDGANVRGAMLSHRAVLTGTALCYSRFRIGAGQRTLSALPFYHRAGLLAGLVQPLLLGQDIITYPLPGAGKRLCHLARQYEPALAVFTPEQAESVLEQAQEGDFSSTSHFLVAGKVMVQAAKDAYARHRIHLCECYLPMEMAMPVACNMAPGAPVKEKEATAPAEMPHHAISGGAPGAAGLLLPGIALRITDIDRPGVVLPLSSPGLIWIKSPCLYSGRPGDEQAAPRGNEKWHCTGEVGCLRADGLLTVGGERTRFSKIKDEIVSHGEIENLIANFLRIEDQAKHPRIAIVGMPTASGDDEQIVLLSTIHKVVGPHDVITLRYDLTNAHYPSHWAPGHIIAMRAIPTLPGGRVDYSLCLAIARKAMGISS